MHWLIFVPFLLQMVIITLDEGVFHLKRGLPRWERLGHPLDTLTVLACLLFVLFVPYSPFALKIYIGLALFSCIFVTKDEFVHKEHCPALENWLHAVLFTLHPITLTCAGFMWPVVQGEEVTPWISHWLDDASLLRLFLRTQFGVMALFFCYQIVFWNVLWKNKPVLKQ